MRPHGEFFITAPVKLRLRAQVFDWFSILPLDNRRAPSETSTEHEEENQITALHATGGHRFIQGDRD